MLVLDGVLCFSGSLDPIELSNDNDTITSPWYPEYYPVQKICFWIYKAPKDHVVAFKFTDFDLGPGDHVDVRDGKNDKAELLRSFRSKPSLNHWWFSNKQFLWTQFRSYSHFTFQGFKMKATFVKRPQGKYFQHYQHSNIELVINNDSSIR